MIRMWMAVGMAALWASGAWGAAPADFGPYFPLAPGTTWKYQVTSKTGDVAAKPYVQTISAAAAVAAGEVSVVPIGDELYLAKDDGVYLFGRRNGEKVDALEQPQKLIAIRPRSGDGWNYSTKTESTYVTCLGNRSVKVEAGEFEAQCIFASSNSTSENRERQTHRYFARGVGLVRETITETTRKADGSRGEKLEISRELLTFSPPASLRPATTASASTGTGPVAPPGFSAAFDAGCVLAEKQDHAAAVLKFDEAIAIDSTQPRPYACKAISLLALKRADEAAQAISVAMKLVPGEYRYKVIAGQAEISRGSINEGKALFSRAAQMSPRDAGMIWTDLAAALAQRQDDKLAGEIESALRAGVAADPPSLEALFSLGQSCAAAGRQEGKGYLRRYLELANQLPEAQRDPWKIQLAKQMVKALEAIESP